MNALGAAAHHSAQQHAAQRSQRTGTRAGEGEVFETREAPRGQNTPHPEDRRGAPQGQPERHTGVGFELVLAQSCRRWRNSWWKLLAFQFKVVLGSLEVFKAQAQDRV